jgi:NTE family protein
MSEPGNWRFTLVLGGGGMRGLAHIGALRALVERGWVPHEVIGTSIGALVAGTWAVGFTLAEMEQFCLGLKRRDIFQIAHTSMALMRLRTPSLYKAEPLEHLIRGFVGDATFNDLARSLIVNSVEINSGMQVYWGLPGLRDVSVADAVFASCALPGFFPPREIQGRHFVDGALVDNLPVRLAAARGADAVVAIDVGATSVLRAETQERGFAALSTRASEIVFQQAAEWHLAAWTTPPMLLVQPRVEHVPMFSFEHAQALMDEGFRSATAALDQAGVAMRQATGGIYPRRPVQVKVIRERCIGCGACVALEPGLFHLDATGKAVGPEEPYEWSPIDGGFIRHCPTYAITARPVHLPQASRGAGTGPAGASTSDGSRGTARARP